MLEQIMGSSNFNYLPRGMTAASMRQEVASNNIANVNTPNFRKTNVEFEELLANELYGVREPEGKLQMVRTHDKHLPPKVIIPRAEPTLILDNTTMMRADDNNVDIDIEMATLAKNQIYYNALATQLSSYVSRMRTAITSGGQS